MEYVTIHSVQCWIAYLEQQGKSRHTIATYRRALEHYIGWSRGRQAVADPKAIVSQWRTYQQTVEKARPATINLRFVALSRFLAWATANHLVLEVAAKELSGLRLSLPRRELKYLNEDDLRKFLEAVYAGGNLRDIAIVALFVGTGLRVTELLQLRLGDIRLGDANGHEITVQSPDIHTIRETTGGQIVLPERKQDDYRTVALPQEAARALLAYLRDYARQSERTVDRAAPLWLGKRGPLGDRTSIRKILNKYALEAHLEMFGPETLRHTFARRYLEANPGGLRNLALILGYTNLRTARLYEDASGVQHDSGGES